MMHRGQVGSESTYEFSAREHLGLANGVSNHPYQKQAKMALDLTVQSLCTLRNDG